MRGMADSLLAFWVIEGADAKAAVVASAQRCLLAIREHGAQEFCFALHYGAAKVRRSVHGLQKPVGPEVIQATRLDRVASSLNQPLIVTALARDRLGETFPLRRLTSAELRDYSGKFPLFTTA